MENTQCTSSCCWYVYFLHNDTTCFMSPLTWSHHPGMEMMLGNPELLGHGEGGGCSHPSRMGDGNLIPRQRGRRESSLVSTACARATIPIFLSFT